MKISLKNTVTLFREPSVLIWYSICRIVENQSMFYYLTFLLFKNFANVVNISRKNEFKQAHFRLSWASFIHCKL